MRKTIAVLVLSITTARKLLLRLCYRPAPSPSMKTRVRHRSVESSHWVYQNLSPIAWQEDGLCLTSAFPICHSPNSNLSHLGLKKAKMSEKYIWAWECQQCMHNIEGVKDAILFNAVPYPILPYLIILYSMYLISQFFFMSIIDCYISDQSSPLCFMKTGLFHFIITIFSGIW